MPHTGLGILSDLYRGELYLKDDRPDKSTIAEGEQRQTRDGKKPGSGNTEKLMHSWETSCKIKGMREPLGVTTTTGKRALDAARRNSYKSIHSGRLPQRLQLHDGSAFTG